MDNFERNQYFEGLPIFSIKYVVSKINIDLTFVKRAFIQPASLWCLLYLTLQLNWLDPLIRAGILIFFSLGINYDVFFDAFLLFSNHPYFRANNLREKIIANFYSCLYYLFRSFA